MKSIFVLILLLAVSQITFADITETYGWEGTETILGMHPADGLTATIVTNPLHTGSQSLRLERVADETAKAYVAWIVGLNDGDVVAGSFFRYDTTPGTAPSCRIWGHWNDDPGDINVYSGSASGQNDYGPGLGWDEATYTWTVEAGHTGLVIEVRIYSNPTDVVWIDDMTIVAPDGATIRLPGYLALENSTWADIKAAF